MRPSKNAFRLLRIQICLVVAVSWLSGPGTAEGSGRLNGCVATRLKNALNPPDFSGVPELGTLPPTALQHYSSEQVAIGIVNRLHQFYEASLRAGEVPYDFQKESKIQLFFHSQSVAKILANGFLNLHQTGTSSAINDATVRQKTDTVFAAMKLEDPYDPAPKNPIHFLRTKSALLDLTRDADLGTLAANVDGTYGDIVAVMLDSIKDRATWTNVDSLSAVGSDRILALDPTMAGLIQARPVSELWATQMGTFRAKTLHRPPVGSRYYEAQIWGPVGFSEVDYFLVRPDTDAAVIASLKTRGHAVFEWKEIITFGRKRFVPGRSL